MRSHSIWGAGSKRKMPHHRHDKFNKRRSTFLPSILTTLENAKQADVQEPQATDKFSYLKLLQRLNIIEVPTVERIHSDKFKELGAQLANEYDMLVSKMDVDVCDRIDNLMKLPPVRDAMLMDDDKTSPHTALIAARKQDIPLKEKEAVQALFKDRGSQDRVVVDKFSVEMTVYKMSCLRPNTWLNDEVINFYMSMLQERDAKLCAAAGGESARRSSHYFSSFFIERLLDNGKYNYGGVKRWSKKFDVFSKDKIFMPVNIRNTHWTMAVVYIQWDPLESTCRHASLSIL